MTIGAMTEDRDAPKALIAPDDILPSGRRGSFVVGSERFMERMLLPGMDNMFDGPVVDDPAKQWPGDYFDLIGGNLITNNAAIRIDQFVYSENEAAAKATLEANQLSCVLSNHSPVAWSRRRTLGRTL